jgi:ATP-dependent Clp protease protease subunit
MLKLNYFTYIKLLINSGGGEIFSGFSIIDTMEYIRPEIITINTGLAASMAAVILCCGTKGKRKSLKRARTMIHQPLSSVMGQCSDIQIEAREIQIIKEELCQIIADRTGQKYSKVYNDCERDYWMDSTKTLDYGLIDSIVKPRK